MSVLIEFSPELMKKHGEVVLRRKYEWLGTESIWYKLDWRNWRLRNVQKWFCEGLEEIGEDSSFCKVVDSFKHYVNPDTRALAILRYVNKFITYEKDVVRWGVKEYWQSPLETWTLKKGDCEDGASLIGAFFHHCGFPPWNWTLCAGEVEGGGHMWFLYTSAKNGLTYHLDWCCWFSSKSMDVRIPFYKDKRYKTVWFGFNSFKSWKSVKNPNVVFNRR